MTSKADRQAAIRELIESNPVASQEALRTLLRQRGWRVTQSTLSRDLRELRVARLTGPEGLRYTIPERASTEAHPALEVLLPPMFTGVDATGELVVLHTLPGAAQPIGVALDRAGWTEVLGTLAGDDTVLLICRAPAARARVVRRLRELARG